MSVPTPNFVLVKDIHDHSKGIFSEVLLASGTFVRPIDIGYVPKHVIDDARFKSFVAAKEVFCYTPKGIMPIPIEAIRKV